MLLEEIQSFSNFELLAQKAKEGFIAGMHKSPFRGFSVEFAEHRPYNPGESVKNIDWKLLARTDKKYIKQFDEETNLKAHLWVDVSKSMHYPVEQGLKLKMGALGAGVMAHILQQQKDSFSLGLFNENGFSYRSPIKSTRGHLQQQIGVLGSYWQWNSKIETSHSQPNSTVQNFESAVLQVGRRHLVVILSDLLWDPAEAAAEASFWKYMAMLRFQKCEILLLQVHHAQHEMLLDLGNRPIQFIDLETDSRIKLQPDEVQDHYLKFEQERQSMIAQQCLQLGIDHHLADVSKPLEQTLTAFFVKRSRML
ncbi:MAG: DUF58 domain-containing protein [Bacteroidetes bacterium]|nr:DUF58 domain-containing protein [Bacteroidota bacterium]NBX64214.1 DUF58 domain-containing protein [Bacteroidota bacterium]